MEFQFFLFFFYSFLILLSTLGYGLVFQNIFLKNNNYLNLSIVGFFGLLSLYLVSSITHLFVPHNFNHNILIHLIGISSFYLFKKRATPQELKIIIIFFLLLFLGFVISKTNEDFGYYHLPMSLQIAQEKLQFGLGNINIAYNHFSSLFHINSLFYLPEINFYLFNLTNFLFQIFFFSGLILLLKEKKNPNFIVILASLIFILYITKFNRLSEYGADLGGQLLAILSFVFCSTAYFERKKLNKENLLNIVEISFYFSIFAVTTKILYIIYFIIPLFISLRILRFKDLLFHFLNLRFLGISILCLTTILFYNFSSSGCLIYPASFTCFYDTVSWSLSEETINLMRSHYNAWSKGGIGAGYSVTDIGSYIKNLNWILNWVDLYFFTKVTDFLGLIFFIFVLICIVFFKNIKWKKSSEHKNHYYLSIYFPVIIVLLIWFFNFPTLRYAGYSIVFLFFAIPLSLFLSNKIDLKNSKVRKKFTILLIISIVVFNLRNLDRINNELSINYDEHHNFGNFPYYWVNDVNFDKHKTQNLILNITEKGSKCWATPSVCITAIGVDTKKISNFIIYYIK